MPEKCEDMCRSHRSMEASHSTILPQDANDCSIAFRKQLLPKFVRPGTKPKHKIEEQSHENVTENVDWLALHLEVELCSCR